MTAPANHDRISRWMPWLLVGVSLILAAKFLWPQFSDLSRTYFFAEYVSKVVPFLTDAHGSALWDFWGLGDPRPRVVTVLVELLTLKIRATLPGLVAWHPGIGIAWLLYPVIIRQIYRLVRHWNGSSLMAGSAALLWAMSPPALDSLVLCYLPAKVLMNLWFVLTLRYASEAFFFSSYDGARLRRPLVKLAIVLVLALLTDETAVVMLVAILLIFSRGFFRSSGGKTRAWIWGAVIAPGVLFLAIAFLVVPLVNRAAGQVPLHFDQLLLDGPHSALIGSGDSAPLSSSHFKDLATKIDPVYLGYTVLSAHLLPFRTIPGNWTYGYRIPVTDWPLLEVACLFLALAAGVGLMSRLPESWQKLALRLGLALVGMVFIYSLLLVPLAPTILEVNYYGALFSLPLCLLGAILVCGQPLVREGKLLALGGVVFLAYLEGRSYEATNQRTQDFFGDGGVTLKRSDRPAWDRAHVQEIALAVNDGRFAEITTTYRYPSPGFCLAFELEAAREKRQGRNVDYLPGQPTRGPYAVLITQQIRWLQHLGIEISSLPRNFTPAVAAAEGAVPVLEKSWPALYQGVAWHGFGDDWEFTRTFTNDGRFTERYWLRSVMRVWRQTGTVSPAGDGSLNFAGSRYNNPSIHTIYRRADGEYLAIDRDGRCQFRFKMIGTVAL